MISLETTKTNHYFRTLAVLAALALAASLLVALTKPAHASTTFTVNSTGDGSDLDLDDNSFVNLCDADPASGIQCTLRAAIQEANHTPEPDTINFNIPGSGVKTISPATFLPPITEQVTIDGYTQPGTSPNTLKKGNDALLKVQLNGVNAGDNHSGLHIQASNIVVRGLAINGFTNAGIFIASNAEDSKVEGNFIGTDASGTTGLGNLYGMYIFGGSNIVGGTSPTARNVISGNDRQGVYIDGGDGNKVRGNYIGTKKNGTESLGNSDEGVLILYASNNAIGGEASGAGNTIAFNGEDGIYIEASAQDPDNANGNRVLGNSIFSNGEEGIDLNEDGVTPNDSGDADMGENDLQNFPVLTSAKTKKGKTTIKGTLDSTPSTTFRVEFFSNPFGLQIPPNPGGTAEGEKFIGEKSVTTGPDGKASFTFKPSKPVSVLKRITATATDLDGNTSEFSAPSAVVQQ